MSFAFNSSSIAEFSVLTTLHAPVANDPHRGTLLRFRMKSILDTSILAISYPIKGKYLEDA